MDEDTKATYVRIPRRLLDVVEDARIKNRRSLTQEIIFRLERDAEREGEVEPAKA